MTLEFTPCQRRLYTPPINIVSDMQIERLESFDLILQSENLDLVRADPNSAVVNIIDDRGST